MASESLLLANVALLAVSITLSSVAIYYYSKGNKKFLSGEFKSYAFWMLLGVILYTIHLIAHLLEEANQIGWIKLNEAATSLTLHAFLVITGIFFLAGSYFYLKLSGMIGYKRLSNIK